MTKMSIFTFLGFLTPMGQPDPSLSRFKVEALANTNPMKLFWKTIGGKMSVLERIE